LNARKPSNGDADGQYDAPQIQSIRFAAFQRGNRDTQAGTSSIGISTLFRSLGTMSFRRSAANAANSGTRSRVLESVGEVSVDDLSSQDKNIGGQRVLLFHTVETVY